MQKQYKLAQNKKFIYDVNEPDSLVMLQNLQQIPHLIFQNMKQVIIIWITDGNILIGDNPQIGQIEQKLNVNVIVNNAQQLKSNIEQKRIIQSLILISPFSQKQFIQQFVYQKQIKRVIYYPTPQSNELNELYEQKKDYHYLYAYNKEQLLQNLEVCNQYIRDRQNKILPNFICLNRQVYSSNNLITTMFAMLNHQIGQNVRNKLITQLQELFKKIQGMSNYFSIYKQFTQQFIKQILLGELSVQRSLFWYTSCGSVFKITNNILRSTCSPLKIFYIQPYFRNLFQAVYQLYQEQSVQKQRSFTCYRGGIVTEKQIQNFIQNIGGIVQSLGFLSTSLNQSIASLFIKNVLFQIVVDGNDLQTEYSYGYASIKQFSQYPDEQQILFNPLNSFKIVSIREQNNQNNQKLYLITLKYGELAKNIKKNEWEINQNQRLYNNLTILQNERLNSGRGQGYIFKSSNLVDEGVEYWQKYSQIVRQLFQKQQNNLGLLQKYVFGLMKMVFFYQEKGQKAKTVAYFQQIQQYFCIIKKENSPKYIQGLYRIGQIYANNGDYFKALEYFLQYKNKSSCTQYRHSNILNNIGLVYRKLGRLKEAQQYHQLSNTIWTNIYGKSHPYYETYLNNIAVIYLDKVEYKIALQYFYKSNLILLRQYGEMHRNYAYSLANIGLIYKIKLQYDIALNYHQKARHILQKLYGSKSYHCMLILNNIAILHKNRGNLEQALSISRQVLHHTGQIYGQLSQQYARNLNNIGALHQGKGQLNEALNYYLKAQYVWDQLSYCQMSKKHYSEHAGVLINIGTIYYQVQKYELALDCYEKAKQKIHRLFGKSHPQYAVCLNSIGLVFSRLQKNQLSLQYFEDSKSINLHFYGKIHPEYAMNLQNIGMQYLKNKNNEEALKYYLQSKQIIFQIFGKLDKKYLKSLDNIIAVYKVTNQLSKAQVLCKQQLKIMLKLFGQNHPHSIYGLNQLGLVYQTQGKLDLAIEYLKKTYQPRSKDAANQDNFYFVFLSRMSDAYKGKGNYFEVLNWYKKIQKFVCQKYSKTHPMYAFALFILGQVYQCMGQQQLSIKSYAKAKKILQMQNTIEIDKSIFVNASIPGFVHKKQLNKKLQKINTKLQKLKPKVNKSQMKLFNCFVDFI